MRQRFVRQVVRVLQQAIWSNFRPVSRPAWWFVDRLGEREFLRTYLGHQNYDEEPGWYLWGEWIYCERPIR
jgi:hypothetical protein